MKRLIVTADDFGRSREINEAVEAAHRDGILTSASLMVCGAAAADAVERARRLPRLSVGLHVTLVNGRPALPAKDIPDLLDTDGTLGRRLVALGVRLALDSGVRRQAAAEMRAQFERYRATGLALGHVDAHHHYHLHPVVFDLLLALARGFGAPAVRIPWEPPLASWRAQRDRALRRWGNALFHRRRVARMRRAAASAGLFAAPRIFGIADSGDMDSVRLSRFLEALPDGVSEIFCHPAARSGGEGTKPADWRGDAELRALVDPGIGMRLKELGIVPTTYAREAGARDVAP